MPDSGLLDDLLEETVIRGVTGFQENENKICRMKTWRGVSDVCAYSVRIFPASQIASPTH